MNHPNRSKDLGPSPSDKTPGQIAYEQDVAKNPIYHDGKPRPTWGRLSEAVLGKRGAMICHAQP